MTETELKFQIPRPVRQLVQRAVATPRARMTRLQAIYLDTADRRLAGAGMALRLRREGPRWVQTLKGRGDGWLQRLEHEVPLGTGAAAPALDPTRHAEHPLGRQLLGLLADGTRLEAVYTTDIQRRHRLLRVGAARIEVAHDRGFISARGRRLEVDELEFELKAGAPEALARESAKWVQRFGLWWDLRTKSERGHRLAAGLTQVEARRDSSAVIQALGNGAELAEGLGNEAHRLAWSEALAHLGLESFAADDLHGAAVRARSRALNLALLNAAFGLTLSPD